MPALPPPPRTQDPPVSKRHCPGKTVSVREQTILERRSQNERNLNQRFGLVEKQTRDLGDA